MPIKVINGNFNVSLIRDKKSLLVKPADGGFNFTDEEVKNVEAAFGKDALRDPVNEVKSAPQKSAADVAAEQLVIVKTLMSDEANLNGNGDLDMKKLNAALSEAGLPEMKAVERDAAQEAATL